MTAQPAPVDSIKFVKELYPRLKPSDDVIARYMDAIDLLPPITIARDGVLVDGYHRWQAHKRSDRPTINAIHLGDLTDAQILRESYRRNSTHGHQLSRQDKRRAADHLYRSLAGTDDERYADIAEVLGLTIKTAQEFCRDARRDEQKALRERVVLDWLDNPQDSNVVIAKRHGTSDQSLINWTTSKISKDLEILEPPESRQHFDIWDTFGTAEQDSTYFGRMPEQVVENLLWAWTRPGSIVVDLFAGSGTTIDVARRMGRRVWASDRASAEHYPHLPIRTHDVADGWPDGAPRKADLILLDPPYWMQAKGRYSDDPADLGNMDLDGYLTAWRSLVKECATHLSDGARLAYIVSPAQDGPMDGGRVVDLAALMLPACWDAGLTIERRIVVPYSTQQATGQQVEAAREHRKFLKLYRDLVVMGL